MLGANARRVQRPHWLFFPIEMLFHVWLFSAEPSATLTNTLKRPKKEEGREPYRTVFSSIVSSACNLAAFLRAAYLHLFSSTDERIQGAPPADERFFRLLCRFRPAGEAAEVARPDVAAVLRVGVFFRAILCYLAPPSSGFYTWPPPARAPGGEAGSAWSATTARPALERGQDPPRMY